MEGKPRKFCLLLKRKWNKHVVVNALRAPPVGIVSISFSLLAFIKQMKCTLMTSFDPSSPSLEIPQNTETRPRRSFLPNRYRNKIKRIDILFSVCGSAGDPEVFSDSDRKDGPGGYLASSRCFVICTTHQHDQEEEKERGKTTKRYIKKGKKKTPKNGGEKRRKSPFNDGPNGTTRNGVTEYFISLYQRK